MNAIVMLSSNKTYSTTGEPLAKKKEGVALHRRRPIKSFVKEPKAPPAATGERRDLLTLRSIEVTLDLPKSQLAFGNRPVS